MRNLAFFIGVLALLWLTACNDDLDVTPNQNTESSVNAAFETAKQVANKAMADFGFSTASRSDAASQVNVLYSPTQPGDTAAFVVNYEEGGFAIVNPRSEEPVYAVSGEGEYLPGTNPSCDFYLSYMLDLPYKPITTDSIVKEGIFIYPEPYSYTYSVTTPAWNQGYPFNIMCPVVRTNPMVCAVTGCTPLAIAEICAYKKYPQQIGQRTLHWDRMVSSEDINKVEADGVEDVAFLIRQIGFQASTVYGEFASGTSLNGAMNAIRSLGYMNARAIDAMTEIRNVLKGSPVLMFGTSDSGGRDASHTWVADGLVVYGEYRPGGDIGDTPEPGGFKEIYYIHCNWGWGGTNNGYFRLANVYPVSSYKFQSITAITF